MVPDFMPLREAYGYFVTFFMLSRAQQALGNEVAIFCPDYGGDRKIKGYSSRPMGPSPPLYLGFNAKMCRELMNFDLVHGHARAALPFLALNDHPPSVVHLHGLPYHATEPSEKFNTYDARAFMYYRALLKKADHVITYCPSLRRRVIDLFNLNPGNVTHIPNGIEPAYFSGTDNVREELGIYDSPTTIYVGRLSEIKGIFEFLEAIPLIISKIPDAKILFVGCNSELHHYLAEYGIEDSCISVPHVPYGEVARYYRSADVHVALSKVYGYQKTVLESLACGTPVISSDYPDGREIVNGAGLFVDPSDPESIAQAVCQAMLDKGIRRCARTRAKVIFKDYNWLRTAEKVQTVYDRLLN